MNSSIRLTPEETERFRADPPLSVTFYEAPGAPGMGDIHLDDVDVGWNTREEAERVAEHLGLALQVREGRAPEYSSNRKEQS